MPERLLRIALPNKGSLSEATSSMLKEAGYKQRADAKDGDRLFSESMLPVCAPALLRAKQASSEPAGT